MVRVKYTVTSFGSSVPCSIYNKIKLLTFERKGQAIRVGGEGEKKEKPARGVGYVRSHACWFLANLSFASAAEGSERLI